MRRGTRPWWVALAISLLLHGGVLGGLRWRLPQWETPAETPSLEVQLVSPPPVPVAVLSPPRPARPAPMRTADRPPSRQAIPEPGVPAEAAAPAAPPGADATPPADAGQAATTTASAGPAPGAVASPPAEAPPSPLNPLPQRLDLHYQLRYGLAAGEQTLLWVNEGAHYTLTSVAGATGLTGLFYRGRFVQTSRGRITPRGLQPEEFWDQRGDKQSSARFDAAHGEITLMPAQGEPRHFTYQGDVQDVLSLIFQLALTAPPPDGQLTSAVFNGKKLRNYTYEVRGEETLDTALGPLRTLHLARVASDDERFDIWLAIDRHYLPVRVLRVEGSGMEGELTIRSIAATE
ncbi:MAG: DUF3108 domain-containing protein [Hydrogenophilales bacterium]|nr:DUF3108 domain-containing protein [Hydrogenophilales bacterium]